jgi:hypothetical protein
MKQHITREQLAEISLKQVSVLADLLGYSEENKLAYEQIPYILNIGKMMEIIKSKGYNYLEFCKQECPYKSHKEYLGISIHSEIDVIENFGETECDALWEAVKYLLNEKKNEA